MWYVLGRGTGVRCQSLLCYQSAIPFVHISALVVEILTAPNSCGDASGMSMSACARIPST